MLEPEDLPKLVFDMRATYAGLILKNPLVLGAGPSTATPRICQKAAQAGWAAVVLKGNTADDIIQKVYKDPKDVFKIPRPAYKLLDGRGLKDWKPDIPRVAGSRPPKRRAGKTEPLDYQLAYNNQSISSPYTLFSGIGNYFNGDEKYLWYINETKRLVQPYDCKVVANVTAYTEEGWVQQIALVNKSKADAVELVMAPPAYGCFDYRNQTVVRPEFLDIFPEIVERATLFCVGRSEKPVSVKLPPYYPDFMAPAKAAERAGARAIHFGDCPSVTSPIPAIVLDPDSLKIGLFPGQPYGATLTQCSAVPYICGAIAQFRLNGVSIDIAGCGGVRDYQDVLRLLLCGASIVEIVTAALVDGLDIASDYTASIYDWMEEKGHKTLKDFNGIAATAEKLRVEPREFVYEVAQAAGGAAPSQRIVLNEKLCINCGWCECACPEMAIETKGKLPVTNAEVCEVCGLCVAVCPMKALTFSPRV